MYFLHFIHAWVAPGIEIARVKMGWAEKINQWIKLIHGYSEIEISIFSNSPESRVKTGLMVVLYIYIYIYIYVCVCVCVCVCVSVCVCVCMSLFRKNADD